MAIIAVQAITGTGTTPVLVAAAVAGDSLALGDSFFVLFRNASAGVIALTLITPGDIQGLAIADRLVNLPIGDSLIKLDSRLYQNPSTKRADVTYSAVAGLTVGVFTI